ELLELRNVTGSCQSRISAVEQVARRNDRILTTGFWISRMDFEPRELVTVVLATRNRCELLPRAVASVMAQTYPRWELIVVDDASADATPAVVQGLDDPRIRAFRVDHRGVSAARNRAL